jgi:NAD(P)-dependent dehydrogenase (short-subunit alcohol dehydrogenase family)
MSVFITGANRGIGLELAKSYRAAGETVYATARQKGDGFLQLDVTDPVAQKQVAAEVDGPLDLLICNAGVYLEKGDTLEDGYAPRLWADSFATNVTGVFLTVQALLPQLRAAKGKVAIISSQMGSDTRAPGGSYIYRASKAAVLNLGRNLAADLAADGIAVGIYHPGWVQTDMGGAEASITVAQSAMGLVARFAHLSRATTGCFETYDGTPHPF